MTVAIHSSAKINLCLDVLRRDASGYHEIQTVYHENSELFDEIILEKTDSGEIIIECDNPDVPLDKTNTAFKAALLLQKQCAIKKLLPTVQLPGARIFIHKRIPLYSGLGGGSSNAVAVLKGLNKLWNLNLVNENLMNLGNQIGMDCTFFFFGGTALGTHFGEKIEPLPPLPDSLKIEIIDTGVKVSSREAYGLVELSKCGKDAGKTKKLIEGLQEKNPRKILENIHNDFEQFIFKKYPSLKLVAEEKGALRALLCGSGGSLFRIAVC